MHSTSTANAVIPFPKRNKGRVRKTQSLWAMGESALRCTSERPENVELLADHYECPESNGTLAMHLATMMFVTMPPAQKEDLIYALRGLAIERTEARELVRFLKI